MAVDKDTDVLIKMKL